MYAKFVNGMFVRAPYQISAAAAAAQGYKPVVLTPAPTVDELHQPREWLEETDAQIIRHWDVVEVAIDPDPIMDDAEALEILLGGAV